MLSPGTHCPWVMPSPGTQCPMVNSPLVHTIPGTHCPLVHTAPAILLQVPWQYINCSYHCLSRGPCTWSLSPPREDEDEVDMCPACSKASEVSSNLLLSLRQVVWGKLHQTRGWALASKSLLPQPTVPKSFPGHLYLWVAGTTFFIHSTSFWVSFVPEPSLHSGATAVN